MRAGTSRFLISLKSVVGICRIVQGGISRLVVITDFDQTLSRTDSIQVGFSSNLSFPLSLLVVGTVFIIRAAQAIYPVSSPRCEYPLFDLAWRGSVLPHFSPTSAVPPSAGHVDTYARWLPKRYEGIIG